MRTSPKKVRAPNQGALETATGGTRPDGKFAFSPLSLVVSPGGKAMTPVANACEGRVRSQHRGQHVGAAEPKAAFADEAGGTFLSLKTQRSVSW